MKKKINAFFLCLLVVIPFLTFGHIRGNLNWLAAYIWYTVCYFLLGILISRYNIKTLIYHLIVFISLIAYLLLLYFESSDYYFPGLAPTILLSGTLGYICGCYLVLYKTISITIIFVTVLIQIYGEYNLLPKYFFYKMKDYPSLSHLKKIKPDLVFQDLNERYIPDSFFKNKVVVLDFWFTGCEACIIKHKEYEKIYNHFSRDSNVVIATVIDGRYNTISSVKSFLSKHRFNFPTLYDPKGKFARRYRIGVDGYPVELRIDKQSKVHEVLYGAGLEKLYINDAITTIQYLINE